MSHKRRFAPLIFAIIALAAAGCGSSGTRSTLVAQADPICKQIAEKRAAANSALSSVAGNTVKQLNELAKVAPGIAVDENHAVAELRKLKAPGALAHGWQKILAGMQQLANDDIQLERYAREKDFKGVQAVLSGAAAVRLELTAIATSDGFTYCGRTS